MRSTSRKVNKWRGLRLVMIWMALIVTTYLYIFHGPYSKVQKSNLVSARLREARLRNFVHGRISYVSSTLNNSSMYDFEDKEHEDDGIDYDEGNGEYGTSPKYVAEEQPQSDLFPTDDPLQDITLLGNADDEVHIIDHDDVASDNAGLRTSILLHPDTRNKEVGADNVIDVKPVRNSVDPHQNRSTYLPSQVYSIIAEFRRVSPGQSLPSHLKPYNIHWTIIEAGNYKTSLYTPPPNEKPIQRFPKAIIIGVGKCGTRALIEFLRMHPFIATARSEIHFFDIEERFNKGLDFYLSLMPLSFSNQITLEKTPSYIWSERAMNEIYKLNKNMKLIVIFKDPVTRAVSQALKNHADNVNGALAEMRDGVLRVKNESQTIRWGQYATYLKMWIEKFSRSQIYIIESTEFVRNPATEVQQVEKFLNIPHRLTEKNFYLNKTKGFYCMRPLHKPEITCLKSGKGRPHPQLNPEAERVLYDHYREHNEELFQLLGRRYQWQPKRNSSAVR